jgi:hypothetical protein
MTVNSFYKINGIMFISLNTLINEYRLNKNMLWLYINEGVLVYDRYDNKIVVSLDSLSKVTDNKLINKIQKDIDKVLKEQRKQYEQYTKRELFDLLDQRGIPYTESMLKDELIDLLVL